MDEDQRRWTNESVRFSDEKRGRRRVKPKAGAAGLAKSTQQSLGKPPPPSPSPGRINILGAHGEGNCSRHSLRSSWCNIVISHHGDRHAENQGYRR